MELTAKRRKHLESCRENNDYSHDVVAKLYSDSFHFIYELLQNADDAEALEVIFNLTAKSLKVTHDGKKLFNYKDVDSIFNSHNERNTRVYIIVHSCREDRIYYLPGWQCGSHYYN